jgi:hypothetical protein
MRISDHISLLLDIVLHYIVIDYQWEKISFIIVETLKATCLFSLFHYYCKKVSAPGVLENRRNWMKLYKILLLLAYAIQIAGVVVTYIV